MKFEKAFYQPFQFTKEGIQKYLASALRDLHIAQKDDFSEVRFSYAYQALIKAGIALLAEKGKVKVRSVPGHHIKILESMSVLLKQPDIAVVGNAMREKRNTDLYGGGATIGEKEADDYVRFVEGVVSCVEREIHANP